MSLLDALLLEEPTPTVQDIFIARRNDGAAGSGTVNDPFDGGTRRGPPFRATVTFDPLDVVAVTAAGTTHGFDDGLTDPSIQISGVTGESATVYNQSFSGANFEIINSYAFRLRLSSTPYGPPSRSSSILATRNDGESTSTK